MKKIASPPQQFHPQCMWNPHLQLPFWLELPSQNLVAFQCHSSFILFFYFLFLKPSYLYYWKYKKSIIVNIQKPFKMTDCACIICIVMWVVIIGMATCAGVIFGIDHGSKPKPPPPPPVVQPFALTSTSTTTKSPHPLTSLTTIVDDNLVIGLACGAAVLAVLLVACCCAVMIIRSRRRAVVLPAAWSLTHFFLSAFYQDIFTSRS